MLQGRNVEADSPCGGSLTLGSTPEMEILLGSTDEVDGNSTESEGRYKERTLGMTVGSSVWLAQGKG